MIIKIIILYFIQITDNCLSLKSKPLVVVGESVAAASIVFSGTSTQAVYHPKTFIADHHA